MTIKYVEIPLFDSVNYQMTIALENNYYQLKFVYNETLELYTLSILDVDGMYLKAGVGLVPNYPILADYAIPNLSGYFILVTNSDTVLEYYKLYPDKIHNYYTMYYVYDSDE